MNIFTLNCGLLTLSLPIKRQSRTFSLHLMLIYIIAPLIADLIFLISLI